jgi:hypothetical protein
MFVERHLWCWLCDVAGAGTFSPHLLVLRELLHPIDPTEPCLVFKPTCDSLDGKYATVIVIILDLVVVHFKSLDP